MHEAKGDEPEGAPIVDVGHQLPAAPLLTAGGEDVDARAKEHGEDGAHLALEQHGRDEPHEDIALGGLAKEGRVGADDIWQRKDEDVEEQDAKERNAP